MTASQMASIYVANQQALRHQAMVDAVYTPAVKNAIAQYKKSILPNYRVSEEWQKQIAEIVANLPKIETPKIEIPDSIIEQASKQFQIQNKELVKVMRSAALGSAINFKLPDGYLDAIAAWREDMEAEAAEADDPSVVVEGLRRLADERKAILKCLERINQTAIMCGLSGVPVPHIVLALLMAFYMAGDVADEILTEREAHNN